MALKGFLAKTVIPAPDLLTAGSYSQHFLLFLNSVFLNTVYIMRLAISILAV